MGDHRRSDAYQRSFANRYVAAEMHTRRNMGVSADDVVMIYCAARVENDVGADDTAGVNNRASANHGPHADAHVGSDDSGRMTSDSKLLTMCLQDREDSASRLIAANGDHDGVGCEGG